MNIINAIINLVKHPIMNSISRNEDNSHKKTQNRANFEGDALECYVQDLFANSFSLSGEEREKKLEQTFSYLGNNSNPPDAMLRAGDAIEVKKIKKISKFLSLNSSYPKHTLKSSNSMITKKCREAEEWDEKDIIYVVGVVNGYQLSNLCMVYGLDYCASEEYYLGLYTKLKEAIKQIKEINDTTTKELGRINNIDAIGDTYMRLRAMWGINNPWVVFNDVYSIDESNAFNFMCVINDEKWSTFLNVQDLMLLAENDKRLTINDIKIKNPDKPKELRDAKLIQFSIKDNKNILLN